MVNFQFGLDRRRLLTGAAALWAGRAWAAPGAKPEPVIPPPPPGVRDIASGLPPDFDVKKFEAATKALIPSLQQRLSISAEYAMPYWLYVPEAIVHPPPPPRGRKAAAPGKVPLVIFLHGYVDGGPKLRMVHPECLTFIAPENQAKHPCFFIAPQLVQNPEYWFGEEYVPRPNLQTLHASETFARDAAKMIAPLPQQLALMDLIGDLLAEFPQIDPDRIIVTGLSSGGYGCYMLMFHFPHHWSAMAPLCAGLGKIADTYLVTPQKVALWSFYNTDEKEVIRSGTDLCLAKNVKLGGTSLRSVFNPDKANGHAAWTWAYAQPFLIPWLFAQKRQKPANAKTRW